MGFPAGIRPECVYLLNTVKTKQSGAWKHALATLLGVAALMTVYEGCKESIFHGTLTPWESHTITIIMTSLFATLAGIMAHVRARSLLAKEREVELQFQKLQTVKLLLQAVNHIVNNFLNHFQLLKLEMEETGKINEATLKLLDESIEEAGKQIRILESIKDPADKANYDTLYPR